MIEKEKIRDYIDSHKSDIVESLKALVRIPSVRGEASSDAPYGNACAEALEFCKELYRTNGFECELDSEGGYLLSCFGEGKKSLGIFAHSDVVPAGEGWIYTSPFEPKEVDGFIVGRGSMDDKAGVLISLYAAKIIKELGIPFNSRLVMFTGSNEESGMGDIKSYLSKHKAPDFSIVPDTAFPLYRGNKGRIRFSLKSKHPLPEGVTISGGPGATVIGNAEASLPYSEKLFASLSELNNERLSAENESGRITLKAVGIPKHSALPEGSLSAAKILCEGLLATEFCFDKSIIEHLHAMSSSHYGEFFGIEAEDCEFGKLTCVLTKISTDSDGVIIADFNIRYGDSVTCEQIISKIEKKAEKIGFALSPNVDFSYPHALPDSNKFVRALSEVIKEYTGEDSVKTYVNAGGTYRQYLKNAVEIGTSLWGPKRFMPAGHGGVHQPDECISVEGLLNAIELTTLMLLECDKEINK